MPLKICIVQFLHGIKDSLYGCIKFFAHQKIINAQNILNQKRKSSANSKSSSTKKSDKLYQRLFESCILNGVFLLSCMLAFHFVLLPVLNYIYYRILSPEKHVLINTYLNPVLQLVFSFVWILPVFLLSKIFNLLWHQEIADIAFVQKYDNEKIKKYQSEKPQISQAIADTIFSCTMELIFLIQSALINFIPIIWVSNLLTHVHLAFLYSLYAFEYKWFNMSWDIEKRISFIETRWPYFFGFGLTLSIILSFAGSYFYCATLFAFIFPAFIISSIESDCEHLKPVIYYKSDPNSMNGLRPVQFKLPLFRLALKVTDFLFKLFDKKKKKMEMTTKNSQKMSGNAYNQYNPARANFTIHKTN